MQVRSVLLITLLLISSSAFASHVKCFSSGKLFYESNSKDIFVGEGFLIVRHNKVEDIVMADCIVRYKTKFSQKIKS